MVIEPLSESHDCSRFDCSEDEINDYLRKYALSNARKDVCRTCVLVDEREDRRVIGYYSLAAGMLTHEDLHSAPSNLRTVVPASMAVPVVMLERFGIDKDYQGQRAGTRLALHALYQVQLQAQTIGIHAVVLEPLNERAAEFWTKLHFKQLSPDPPRMYLTLKFIRTLGLGQQQTAQGVEISPRAESG